MEHIAIDLGSRESQICVRSADGKILEEKRWATSKLRSYLEKRPPSRVILETCAEAFRVADAARELGHDPCVVPATLAPALGVGERRTKTDTRDARKLSEVSTRVELESVHIPSETSRLRKSQSGAREAMVSSRTQHINLVRGWMRGQGIRIRSGQAETFTARVTQAVAQRPLHIELTLQVIDALSKHIETLETHLIQQAKADPVCRRLMTVPGVGPAIAIRFTAALDDIARFESAHKVEAYLGLTPGEHSSSDKKQRTAITKAGSPRLRWALVQGAWAARRSRGVHPMLDWSRELEKRRGKRVAAVALARKLAGILYAIWRDGTVYNPRQAAGAIEGTPMVAIA
jgi:transposase